MEFIPICIKLYVDMANVDLQKFIDEFSKIGHIVFDKSMPIIFMKYSTTEEKIKETLHFLGLDYVYKEQIEAADCVDCDTFIKTWYSQKYNNEWQAFINDRYAEQLDIALENINKARKEILSKIIRKNEGGLDDGRARQENCRNPSEKKGPSA